MRTRAWICSVAALTAAQIAIVEDANAAQGQAVLIGVVRDGETGKPVEGAAVVIQGENLQGEQSTVTDSYGLYRLPNLPPGEYLVQVFSSQHAEATHKGLNLRANATIRHDIVLSGAREDVETVVVEAPTVDVGSSTTGIEMDEEFNRRVPLVIPGSKGSSNRSFEAAAQATPGAQSDTYGTSISGSTSPENQYWVDGMSVNDPAFGINGTPLSTEFLTTVDVVNGGYMPEFGRSTGGVITATTKSGSNEFHGSVWAFYSPGQLEGRRKVPRRAGQTIVTERELGWIGDVGFDLGGRLIKDRLWFYTGFQAARTVYDINRSWNRLVVDANGDRINAGTADNPDWLTERIPGTEERRKAQSTTYTALAKLTFRANEQHNFDLLGVFMPTLSGSSSTFALDPRTGSPEIGSFIGDFSTLAHRNPSTAGDLLFTWTATTPDKDWTFETKVGWHHQDDRNLPSDGSAIGSGRGLAGIPTVSYRRNFPDYHPITDFMDVPPGVDPGVCGTYNRPNSEYTGEPGMSPYAVDDMGNILQNTACPVTSWATGGAGFLYERRFERFHGRHVITKLARGAGHHVIKFGVDAEYMQYESHRGYSGGNWYRESTTGSNFADFRNYGYLLGPDEAVRLDSLKWTVSSATIGAFLQDSWSVMDRVTLNLGLRYDAQFLFNGDGDLAMALPNQVSPRLGVIWDPTYDGRSKVFGNYARYYQSVPLNIADRAASGEPQIMGFHDASTCDPTNIDQHEGVCQTQDNLFQIGGPGDPDQRYLQFAGRTPVDPKLRPQSTDEFLLGGEYEVFANGRLGLMYQRRWQNRIIEDMSRDEAQTYFIGNPGYGIAADFPKARRTYDALTLYFQKRFSDHWLMAASYTASWLRGNIAGLYRPETGQLDPNINSDFDLQSLLANRYGYLPGDSRHQIKVFSAGDIPLSNTSFLMLGGGFRANSGGPTNVLASHNLYGGGESFLAPRGSGERLPWVFRLDTNVGYRYQVNEDLGIAVTMDVFNVANFQTPVAIDETYTFQDVNPPGPGVSLEDHTDVEGAEIDPNPNFGRVVAYQAPRQFRFGIRFTF